MPDRIITNIYIWQNRMVMVFDQHGQQMPEYQGPVEDVREKLRSDAPSSARWWDGEWRGGVVRPIVDGKIHCMNLDG